MIVPSNTMLKLPIILLGIVLLLTKRLIIFQYVLGSVEKSLSFLLNCLMYFSFASKFVFVH